MSITPRQRGVWIETSASRAAAQPATSITPRQRGVWIETFFCFVVSLWIVCITPRQRGVWIETAPSARLSARTAPGITPRQRGVWIETSTTSRTGTSTSASPLGNEGCGLKHRDSQSPNALVASITPRQRGVWIETPLRIRLGDAGSGRITPRQRGVWIETKCNLQTHLPPLASPLGNEGCGLKRAHYRCRAGRNDGRHHPSATRGVD